MVFVKWRTRCILFHMEEYADLHCHLSGSIAATTFSVKATMPLDEYLGSPFSEVEHRHGNHELFDSDVQELANRVKHYTEIRFNPLRRIKAGLSLLDMASSMILAMRANNRLKFIMTLSREDGVGQYGEAIGVLCQAPFCGIDLAGREIPDDHELNPAWFRETAGFFRDVGKHIGVAYHVGETGSFESIRRIVGVLGGVRIGHGLGLVSAPDSFYHDYRFSVEVCPTANLKTLTATDSMLRTHIRRLMYHQTPFCFNTDSPKFLQTDIVREHFIGEGLVQGSASYSRRSASRMRFTKYVDEQSA